MMKNRARPLRFAALLITALFLVSCGARLSTDVDSEQELLRVFDADSRYTVSDASDDASRSLDDLMDYPEGLSPASEDTLPSAVEETPEPPAGEPAVVLPLLPVEETDSEEPLPDRSLPEDADEDNGPPDEGGEEAPEKALPGPDAPQGTAAPASETYYVLNTNTKKFHRPTCSSVATIKSKNYAEAYDRDAILRDGYSPCKRCDP